MIWILSGSFPAPIEIIMYCPLFHFKIIVHYIIFKTVNVTFPGKTLIGLTLFFITRCLWFANISLGFLCVCL